MNLLGRTTWLGLLSLAVLTYSCETTSEIGLELDPDGSRVGVFYTELTLPSTNIFIDSLRTDEDLRLLVGRNVDPIFGTTEAIALSQLSLFTLIQAKADTDIYILDSAFLDLELSYIHTGTSLGDFTFSLHQLQDTLFSTPFYLANFQTDFDANKIDGEFNLDLSRFSSGISNPDTLTVQLSNEFGNTLFGLLQKGNSFSDELRNNFKGLAIVGDDTNEAILGFNPEGGTKIFLNYHIADAYLDSDNILTDSVLVDSLVVELAFSANNLARYNQIKTNRNGSVVGTAIKSNLEEFDIDQNNVYLQSASGIYPLIDFTPLNKFFDSLKQIQINRMDIVIETVVNDALLDNAADFRFFFLEENFDISGNDTIPNGTYKNIFTTGLFTNRAGATAILSEAAYLSNQSTTLIAPLNRSSFTHEGSITFFAQLVENGSIPVRKIVLMPSDQTNMGRSTFDKGGIKLKMFYTLPN